MVAFSCEAYGDVSKDAKSYFSVDVVTILRFSNIQGTLWNFLFLPNI